MEAGILVVFASPTGWSINTCETPFVQVAQNGPLLGWTDHHGWLAWHGNAPIDRGSPLIRRLLNNRKMLPVCACVKVNPRSDPPPACTGAQAQFVYECLLRLSQGSRTGLVGGLTGRLRMPGRRRDVGDRSMGGPTVGGAHTGR
jgi:hypothetical protein